MRPVVIANHVPAQGLRLVGKGVHALIGLKRDQQGGLTLNEGREMAFAQGLEISILFGHGLYRAQPVAFGHIGQ